MIQSEYISSNSSNNISSEMPPSAHAFNCTPYVEESIKDEGIRIAGMVDRRYNTMVLDPQKVTDRQTALKMYALGN